MLEAKVLRDAEIGVHHCSRYGGSGGIFAGLR
jgi:hypothetical protein